MSRPVTLNVFFLALTITATGAVPARTAQPQDEAGSAPLRRVLAAHDRKDAQDLRIVGGFDTTIEKHPWQVALVAARVPTNTRAQFCGGSIVGARWVLTAAHCLDGGTQPTQVDILTGTSSLETGGTRIKTDRIVIHEKWDPDTFNFDIALLHLEADAGGTRIAGAVTDAALQVGKDITITGWGALAFTKPGGSKVLQQVNVPYVSTDVCNHRLSYNNRITENMLCAGKEAGGQDSCQGDSGGPATLVTASGPSLVGIVSWGDGCGFPRKYGVYTRLSKFAPWVKEKSNGDVSWP